MKADFEKQKIKSWQTKRLVVYALMLAVITMLTLFASIPLPVGSGGAYLNAGDAAVFASAFLLGGWGGAIVSAAGSALADALHGSAIYIPATFVIKGLMALICGLLYSALSKKRADGQNKISASAFAAIPIAGIIMPLGYFAYELLLYGGATALVGLWTNAIQYAFGVSAGIAIFIAFNRTAVTKSIREQRAGRRNEDYSLKSMLCKAGIRIIDGGLTTGTAGNISIRKGDVVYITPTATPYHDVRPRDIPVYRLDGVPVKKPLAPSMELNMHLNVYKKRVDVNAIVHTHSPALIALGNLAANGQEYVEELRLPIAPPMPAGSEQLAEKCCIVLGDYDATLLKGHGAVIVGKTLDEALARAFEYEKRATDLVRQKQYLS